MSVTLACVILLVEPLSVIADTTTANREHEGPNSCGTRHCMSQNRSEEINSLMCVGYEERQEGAHKGLRDAPRVDLGRPATGSPARPGK